MKKILLRSIQRKLNSNPYERGRWGRRLKIAVGLTFVFTILIGGAAVWAAVSVFHYVQDSQPKLSAKLSDAGTKAQALTAQPLTTEACLGTLKTFISPSQWLLVPWADNYRQFQNNCLKPQPEGAQR